ncbi:MAG: hypothetical protein KZQ81_07470, partial [Candidatus Thiodiazotropha sp. (ex Rostrolucina anterorostrata)]|nr:hypothetical protein [Candidatus Thiodiazotropha sp. (ex Rostrolucina anterorostrata)]
GCFDVSQQQINQIRRFYSISQTPDSVITHAYNRADYLEHRKPVMEWWSKHIEAAAVGNMCLTGSKGLKIIGMK